MRDSEQQRFERLSCLTFSTLVCPENGAWLWFSFPHVCSFSWNRVSCPHRFAGNFLQHNSNNLAESGKLLLWADFCARKCPNDAEPAEIVCPTYLPLERKSVPVVLSLTLARVYFWSAASRSPRAPAVLLTVQHDPSNTPKKGGKKWSKFDFLHLLRDFHKVARNQ